jgi:hypothetical protein
MRIEPLMSLPMSNGTSLAATSGSRSAAGPTGRASDIPWVARATEDLVVRLRAHRQRRHVRLAKQIAPAAFRRAATVLSTSGEYSANGGCRLSFSRRPSGSNP